MDDRTSDFGLDLCHLLANQVLARRQTNLVIMPALVANVTRQIESLLLAARRNAHTLFARFQLSQFPDNLSGGIRPGHGAGARLHILKAL